MTTAGPRRNADTVRTSIRFGQAGEPGTGQHRLAGAEAADGRLLQSCAPRQVQ